MRFTGTSSACSPRGPSASVTVHRSSFWALRAERRVIRRTRGSGSPGDPAPRPQAPPSKSARRALSPLFPAGQGGWARARRGSPGAPSRAGGRSPDIRSQAARGGGGRQGAAETGPRTCRPPDDPGSVGPSVGDLSWSGAWGRTYPAKQCAAVSTQDAATRTPPHRGCPPSCSLTSQGQAPGGAALPPTMRPWARVTLTALGRLSPHGPRKVASAGITGDKSLPPSPSRPLQGSPCPPSQPPRALSALPGSAGS